MILINIMSRNLNIECILEKINYLSDESLDKMHRQLCQDIEDGYDNMKRPKKTKYIQQNIKMLDDDTIKLYRKIINDAISVENTKNIMNDVALKIINQLLKKMNRDEIIDFVEFKNIRRDELLNKNCKDVINENLKYIFDNGFDKKKCGYYGLNSQTLKNSHLSIIKGMLKEIGYKLASKTLCRSINGEKIFYCSYKIKKIQ
jgi:hypothetical protein